MLILPSFFYIACQSWDYMFFYGLWIILKDKNMKWSCVSGKSSQDKHSIKKNKQPIMILKS